jgi:hypothetical protein
MDAGPGSCSPLRREVTVTTFLLKEGFDMEMFDAVQGKTKILRRVLDDDWDTDIKFTNWGWKSSKNGEEFELVPTRQRT